MPFPTNTFNGDVPYANTEGYRAVDYRNVFESDLDKAFTTEINIPGGYGLIPSGTVMAKVNSTAGSRIDMYVPYTKVDPDPADINDIGKIPLSQNGDTSGTIYIPTEYSYRLVVGEELRVVDSDTTSGDLGSITAIDITTNPYQAAITTQNPAAVTYTVANGACVSTKTKVASPYTEAVGFLQGAVDTGVGANARGGKGVLVYGNASARSACVCNYDATALTDMAAKTVGRVLYLK